MEISDRLVDSMDNRAAKLDAIETKVDLLVRYFWHVESRKDDGLSQMTQSMSQDHRQHQESISYLEPSCCENSLGIRESPLMMGDRDRLVKPVEILVFTGVYPCGWISRAERFFRRGHYTDEEKLRLVSMKLEDNVLNWFKHISFNNWKDFKSRLYVRFGNITSQYSPITVSNSEVNLVKELSQEAVSSEEKTHEIGAALVQQKTLFCNVDSSYALEDLTSAVLVNIQDNLVQGEIQQKEGSAYAELIPKTEFSQAKKNALILKAKSQDIQEHNVDMESSLCTVAAMVHISSLSMRNPYAWTWNQEHNVFDRRLMSRHALQRQRQQQKCSKSWKFKFKDT